MKLICQTCGEHIGNFDPFSLRLPLTGGAFVSPDPLHGVPPPFFEGEDYEHMTCPYGKNHKPFAESDKVLSEVGIVWVRGNEIVLLPSGESDRNTIGAQSASISEEDAERITRERLGTPRGAPPVVREAEAEPIQQHIPDVLEESVKALDTADAINQVLGNDPFEFFRTKGKRK